MTKEAKREYARKRYQTNREKILEQRKHYYQENAEQIKEYSKQYNKQYRQENAKYYKEYQKQYRQTPFGRASYLVNNYNQSDKKYNRGRGDLTSEWIVENIFTKPCHYCGETDWSKIGCDRIDNSKPHTEDNVVPCCEECNRKRQKMDYNEFKKKMG